MWSSDEGFSKPLNQAAKYAEIFDGEVLRALEIRDAVGIYNSDQQQNQQIRIDKNALALMLRYQRCGVEHYMPGAVSRRIFMDSTSPVSLVTVNTLYSRSASAPNS